MNKIRLFFIYLFVEIEWSPHYKNQIFNSGLFKVNKKCDSLACTFSCNEYIIHFFFYVCHQQKDSRTMASLAVNHIDITDREVENNRNFFGCFLLFLNE